MLFLTQLFGVTGSDADLSSGIEQVKRILGRWLSLGFHRRSDDFPGNNDLDAVVIGFRPSTSRHGLQFSPLQTDVGSPGSQTRCLRTCTGSLTARDPGTPCGGGAPGVAFRQSPRASASRSTCRFRSRAYISRLNTRPVRPPVNASTPPSRAAPHDSGPLWFAKPSTYETFIHDTLPV